MNILRATAAVALLIIAANEPVEALAQSPEPVVSQADQVDCAIELSPSVRGVWLSHGGRDGGLGCPTGKEAISPKSPLGTPARVVMFGLKGEIVEHVDGPRAGQAFAVVGCFFRLHSQFSGTGGWLGLPIAEQTGAPGGASQVFEGGVIEYTRLDDSCDATPNAALERPSPSSIADTPLVAYENAAGDREILGSARSVELATSDGYHALRAQARVMTASAPGALALKLYENEAKGAHVTVATPQSVDEALADGFSFVAGQGWIWSEPRPGALPLKSYRDPASGRGRLAVSAADEAEATAAGFVFERVEGYAEPAP